MTAVERVLEQIEHERRQRVDAGLCACGCGTLLSPVRRANRIYENERHRDHGYRDRLSRLAAARGVGLRATARSLETGTSTGNRRADAPRAVSVRERTHGVRPRKPRNGVSVYLPTPALAAAVRDALDAVEHPRVDLAQAVAAIDRALKRRAKR